MLGGALSMLAALARPGDAADPGMVRVDIYRPENSGLMSSVGCLITIVGDPRAGFCHDVIRGGANRQISGGTTTVLLGGDRVVCEIRPSGSIQAFTPRAMRPDGSAADAGSWAATTLAPRARPGETVEVGVVPKRRGSTYLGGWLLVQEPHAATLKRVKNR